MANDSYDNSRTDKRMFERFHMTNTVIRLDEIHSHLTDACNELDMLCDEAKEADDRKNAETMHDMVLDIDRLLLKFQRFIRRVEDSFQEED